MFRSLLCVLLFSNWIHRGNAVCEPKFTVPTTEVREGGRVNTECSFLNQPECDNLDYIAFQRSSQSGEPFQTALKLYRSQEPEYIELMDYYTLQNRIEYLPDPNTFLMAIAAGESVIDDSGIWRCNFFKTSGEEHPSEQQSLEITLNELMQTNIAIGRIETGPLMLNESYSYWCSSPRVYPKDVLFEWKIGERVLKPGRDVSRRNGYVWTVNNTIEISVEARNETSISCRIAKTNGLTWSGENFWPIPETFAPARIESFNEPGDIIKAICLASGDDVSITWFFGEDILESKFINEETVPINGSYRFGQTSALESTLTLVDGVSVCVNIQQLEGTYTCTASGMAGTSSSDKFDVSINQCNDNTLSDLAIVGITVVVVIVIAGLSVAVYWFKCRSTGETKVDDSNNSSGKGVPSCV